MVSQEKTAVGGLAMLFADIPTPEPKDRRGPGRAASVPREQVQEVFDYWVKVCRPRARTRPVLSGKRSTKIANAIRLYGIETCLRAIDGVTKSDFHMGVNNRGKEYTDIELILRDERHIEQFSELYYDWLERSDPTGTTPFI